MWTTNSISFRRIVPFHNTIGGTFFALALVLELVSPSAQAKIALRFGVYTSDKPTTMVQRFRPTLNILEAKLSQALQDSVSISLTVAPSYARGLSSLVNGEVDFAQFGPASYVQAKEQNPKIAILAIEGHHGKKVFYGIICVPADSQIRNVSQLTNKTFAFGNKRSTIGRYLSQLYLLEHGIPARRLKSYRYLKRHDLVGAAVGRHEFDAGALKDSTFAMLVSRGIKIREIARFPNVAKPWIASSKLSRQLRAALTQALLEVHDPAALRALGADGFLVGQDSDYDIIRRALARDDEFFSAESANRAQ